MEGGQWVVNDKAQVWLQKDGENKDIEIIDKGAVVELRGSGKLNDMSQSSSGLTVLNSATLLYRDASSAILPEQLDIRENGALRLINSKLTVSADLQLGLSFIDLFGSFSSATLDVDATSELKIDNQFEVNSGGLVTINGKLTASSLDIATEVSFSGSGTINGSKFTNHGKLIPGTSPGILTIEGDYEQTETGELEIEIFGTEVGSEYDQLLVTGTATLNGTLRIIPRADIPAVTLFEPLMATSIVGAFSRIIVESESARSSYEVSTMPTNIQITPKVFSVSSYTEYQDALFSETDAADETIGLTTSDPDNDQFSNLLEYAMDLNPWVTNANPAEVIFEPDATEGFGRVKVKFPWAKDMTDVDYVIQVSPDMSAWTDLASTVQETVDHGTHNLLTVEAAIDPPAEERLFVRVMVVEVP